jgi:outer membrane protein
MQANRGPIAVMHRARRVPSRPPALPAALATLAAIALLTGTSAVAAPGDPFATAAGHPAAPAQTWSGALSSPPCNAGPLPEAIALVDALDRALCTNPQTRQTWAAARTAAAEVGVARSAYLPNVTGTLGVQRANARNTIAPGTRDQATGTLSFNYLLLDAGGRDAALDQARDALLAADWTHDATLQTVLQSTTDAYFGLFAAEEAVAAAITATRASQQSLDAARGRQAAGAATRADVLQAQTALSQARLTQTQAEGDAAAARGVLANRMGLPASRLLRIAPPADVEARRLAEAAVDRLIDAALLRRPDILAADAQVRSAEASVRVQESASRPSVSATANLNGTSLNPGLDTRTGAVGLSLTVPLFTGFQLSYRIRAAQERVEQRLADRDRLRNDVSLEVWQAYQAVRTQGEALGAAADLVASATESYELALGRYRAGAGTVADLMNAQSALASANLQRIQARYRWNVAKVTLARAVGMLDMTLFTDVRQARGPNSGETKP